jgi:Fanconi anemia group M protein
MKNEDNEHLFHDLFKGSLNASTEHVTSRLNGKMTLFDEKKKQNDSMQKNNLHSNIVADDREYKSDVISFLSEIENVDLSIERLSMGDYQVENQLIVERKTLNDFAISIIDGRLLNK